MHAQHSRLQDWFDEYDAAVGRGRAEAALAGLIAHLAGGDSEAARWQLAAERLFQAQHFDAAVRLLDAALEKHGATGLYYWRGNALRMCGRLDAAERDLRLTLEREPGHRDAAFSLAFMLREQGRIEAAADALTALWQARSNDREIALAVIEFLRESGAHARARVIAQRAADSWPEDARMNAVAGETLLALGEFVPAHALLERALEHDRNQSTAWLRLAQCQRYTQADAADIRRLRGALTDSTLARTPRICAGFALGKALDDLGEFAEATAVLRSANQAAAADVPWDEDVWQRFVDAQLVAPALPRIDFDPGFVPVFVTGLPRSGTTLVATRLGRHAQIRDRGELNWIGAIHEQLTQQGLLRHVRALTASARLIAAQMRRDDAPVRYVLDKNPLNFRHLDLILALFPRARIIHCRRGERDCALSMWQQHFAHPDLAFSYRFDAIALFMQGYQQLMRHRRIALADCCIEVEYENLVADEPATLRGLFEFLDLESTRSGDSLSTVTTASVWQARQPTYQRSVGRWRNYAPFVPELEAKFVA